MAPSPLAIPLMADAPSPLPPLPSSISSSPSSWIPVHATTASVASAECFVAALVELVHYPERSSSTILRADILVDHDFQHDLSASDATGKGKARATESPFDVDGYQLTRRIRRKILPKRPQFDHAMEQECLFYSRQHAPTTVLDEGLIRDKETLVLFVVDLDLLEKETGKREPPYYHPQVSTLAFRYLPACLTPRPGASPSSPTLRIDLVPLPESQIHAPLEPQDRLFRTSMMLLRSIDKVMKGSANGYEKRVHHDLLVAKERVQDVYQGLKSKYSFLAATWAEKTDPSKHVFEDVAICAWLMCLWETMYPPRLSDRDGVERAEPEGGFCDVGCGNGLLVYLLNAEGYRGYGVDLRSRKSWALYSPAPDLRVTSLSPPTILRSALSNGGSPPFPPKSFLIGNHADELTPWIPLFAALTPDAAWLNIPCCLHALAGRFETMTYSIPAPYLDSLPEPPSPPPPSERTPSIDTHPLLYPFYQPSPSNLTESSRYNAYQLFLAHLSLRCGFLPEREALRIPSTKNYGLVGRKRLWDLDEDRGERDQIEARVRQEVETLVNEVERHAGSEGWKARTPEGKISEH